MKLYTLIKFATALALMAGILSMTAGAADQKIDHAMACVPLSPQTTYDKLYYRPAGLKNISSSTQYVVCPLTVDADSVGYWTATDSKTASLAVTFQTPNAGTANCEVSIGSNLDGTKATFSGSTVFAAGSVNNVNISGINGDSVTQNFMVNYPVSLYCTMPPESTILRVRLIEYNVDTDDSTL